VASRRLCQPALNAPAPDQIKAVLDALRCRRLSYCSDRYAAAGRSLHDADGDINLDSGKIRIEQSLEQTNTGPAFKGPKTKANRRTVSISPSIVVQLRDHWRWR